MNGASAVFGQSVSRETEAKFETYLKLLRKWSRRINLVAPATLDRAEARHLEDSLQLFAYLPKTASVWADLGSGGGFPGLAIAILARERAPELKIHLIESDHRKVAFLRTVSRETETPVTIHPSRIEMLEPIGADIVSARALAPLPKLLGYAARHLGDQGTALLPKGKNHAAEVVEARKTWEFECEAVPSATDPSAVILKIGDLSHV